MLQRLLDHKDSLGLYTMEELLHWMVPQWSIIEKLITFDMLFCEFAILLALNVAQMIPIKAGQAAPQNPNPVQPPAPTQKPLWCTGGRLTCDGPSECGYESNCIAGCCYYPDSVWLPFRKRLR
uniref:WAP domain-containing protein n=1 Tax=Romanomermis culicivorax TaxID=13658 RepID=A0A915JAV8_ROMCU